MRVDETPIPSVDRTLEATRVNFRDRAKPGRNLTATLPSRCMPVPSRPVFEAGAYSNLSSRERDNDAAVEWDDCHDVACCDVSK